jgi:DNA mismatch endonuclease (patch repair protein)
MKGARQRDTAPELAVRSAIRRLAIRYRVNYKVLPGSCRRADLAFLSARVALFVDGCFWHGCPIHGTWPKANAEFWRNKIETNQKRDRDTDERLREAGWLVVRAWEHDDPNTVASHVAKLVQRRLHGGASSPMGRARRA